MIAVVLRGLLTRKLRTVLTMIAIILGVSMISGTYILTDTINNAFLQIFTQADRHIDAVVQPHAVVESSFNQPPPLPASLLTVIQGTPGVAAAEGEIADQASLYDLKGKNVGALGGAPTLLFSVPQARFRSSTLVAGRYPSGNEVALDQGTVNRNHLRLGQQLKLVAVAPAALYTLVGIEKFGNVSSLGGAALVGVDLPTAQRITGKIGKYDQIAVAASPGVTHAELVARIKARIPPALHGRVDVKTSEQNVQDQTNAIASGLSFLTIGLLAFGGVAVFVGAFIIFNTFSITVAQRTREFGLLRTIGATRAQVLRSVIGEALLVGLLASVLGLLFGFLIARGLNALFDALGATLPSAGLVVEVRTVIVALLVGTIVTLLAGLTPAIRATRVPPVAALREGAQLPGWRFARYTPLIAAAVSALALALLLYGIFGSIDDTGRRLLIIAAGALLLFLGIAMLSPKLIAPLATWIGWPIERGTRITGRLARENAVRNPSRTAITAAALMIGLALVGFVTIFAAELRKTATDAIDREVAGTFAVYAQNQQGQISAGVAPLVRGVPGVQLVSALNEDTGQYAGIGHKDTTGIQPSTFGQVYRFQWKQGSGATLTGMGPRDALISDTFATAKNLRVGSNLSVTTPTGRHDAYRVTGIFKMSILLSDIVIRHDTLRRDWALNKDLLVVVQAEPGANQKALQKRINAVLLAHYPGLQAYSQQDIKNQDTQGVNQLLTLIYILLAMSVLVSLFGIINTLVLSVYERTREIGMLRAIGTTRRQVRWIIRWESVITSVIGAILGLLLGILLAVLITAGLQSQGIEYALPVGQLLIWVVFAIVFGIVAAAFPARRAARLDVLQAIAYE
jgi:putative ABC transport system permease protein